MNAELLHNNDGLLLMVRGTDPAQVHADALASAEHGDLVVLTDLSDVRVEYIRAMPCDPGGHPTDLGECDGTFDCHYQPGLPGQGAFLGAFIQARPKTRDERRPHAPAQETTRADQNVDRAVDAATALDTAAVRARLARLQFLTLAAPAPGNKGRPTDVALNAGDLEALGVLVAHDVPRLLDLAETRAATIRMLASHRAADARALDSVTRRAEDFRKERDAAQRCLRQLLDALQLLAARWQGPAFQAAYGDALLTVMRNPAQYLKVTAASDGATTLTGGGRAVTRLLAERLAEHAHCDRHPVSDPEPGCGCCQDRAAYLAYLAAGGPDFRVSGGTEVPLSDIPPSADPATCADCEAVMPGDHRPGCAQDTRAAAALNEQFPPEEPGR